MHFQHDYHDDADFGGGSSIETNPYSNEERSKVPQSGKLQFDPFEFGFFLIMDSLDSPRLAIIKCLQLN